MAGPPAQVAVIGMAALRRDINKLADNQSSRLYNEIKKAGKEAAEPVAARARADYPHGPSGNLSASVRTSGTKTGAAVRAGSKAKAPYAGWIDFGGSRPDTSTRQFVQAGRYLFPAAAGLASRAAELYSAALERTFSDPSVWTNTSDDGSKVRD